MQCSHSAEIAYNVKHVARHGRASPHDPFSIRQTGIYQKFQSSSATSVWILLQPPETLSERLTAAAGHHQVSDPVAQLGYHVFIFQCLSENWRDYINYFEENFTSLVRDNGATSALGKLTYQDGSWIPLKHQPVWARREDRC